ncbi:MAG: hypothetical protein N2Z72_00725 [Bacteroidales bacterium]|nr:hypothetical protein [Bacteroidales bacterium]
MYPGKIKLYQSWIIVLLSFILYAQTISYDYALDDLLMITGNTFTQKGLAGTYEIFTNDAFAGLFGKGKTLVAGGRYRPLTHFMFALEKELFGFNPHIGHLINVLLYSCLGWVVFRFLLRIAHKLSLPTESWWSIPFLTALIFVVHPLHTEVVANIKGRDEICSLLFSLISIVLAWRYFEKPNIIYWIGSFLMFTLALFSKENAIMWLFIYPFFLFLIEKNFLNRWKNVVLPFLSLLLPAIIFIAVRSWVLGGLLNTEPVKELMNNPFVYSTKSEELATIFYTWLLYFKLLIIPYPLTHDYYPFHIQITNFSDPLVWIGLFLTLFSFIYALIYLRKKPWDVIGIGIFWGTFIISSNLFFNIGTFMNERFMFTPLLGFSMFFVGWFKRNFAQKKWINMAFMMVAFIYSLLTILRNPAWKNNYTLFSTDVKTSYRSAKVNVSLAEILLQMSDETAHPIKKKNLADTAIFYLNRAEKIYPLYIGVYDLRGKAHFIVENFEGSYRDYVKAIQIAPERKVLYDNLFLVGLASLTKKQYHVSKSAFLQLMKLQPDSVKHPFQLSIVYDQIGKYDSTFYYLHAALKKDSIYVPALNKMGEMYGRVRHDFAQSEKWLLKAYSLDSTYSPVLENLGVLYGMKQQFTKSLYYLKKAHRLNPKNPQILRNIAISFDKLGMKDSASYYWQLSQKK